MQANRRSLLLITLLNAYAGIAQSEPQGATVVNGSAIINNFSNGMQIINTPGTIIDWNSFSIEAGKTVRFDQTFANSAILNRVTGQSASDILGTLQSNGRVFLINPNGIIFGAGSKVDTAGFIASTLNISNEDFLAGKYHFQCNNSTTCDAGVDVLNPTNQRIILKNGSEITTRTAGNGGQVWLIARDRVISEKGSKIDAPSGQVIAAAAREVSVTSPSFGQMRFTLNGITSSKIDLAGDIKVERGAAGFFADTVRLAGKVQAFSEKDAAGQITAQAATDVLVEDDARLSVSGVDGADAGAIRLTAGRRIKVAASTEIAADGGDAGGQAGKGGLIDFRAAAVNLPSTSPLLFASPNVHALGYGKEGLELSRFGRIQVTETGTFTTQVLSGPSWHSESDSFYDYAQGSQGKDNNWSVGQPIPSSDGQYLVLSQENRVSTSRANTDPTGNENRVSGVTWQAQILGADGSLVSTITLVDMSTPGYFTGYYGVQTLALGKGGWVVQEADNRLHFISAQGALTTVDLSARIVDLKALLGGGLYVTLQDSPESREVRVYSATGTLLTDQNAALRNENLTRVPYAYGTDQNNNCLNCVLPDPRQGLRSEASSLQQLRPGQAIEVLDLPTGAVAFSHGTVPVNGGVLALTQAGAIVGVGSSENAYKGSMKLQSGGTSEALPFNSDFTASSTNNVIPGKGGTITELQKGVGHAAAPVSSHTFAITSDTTERNGTYTYTPKGDVFHTNITRVNRPGCIRYFLAS